MGRNQTQQPRGDDYVKFGENVKVLRERENLTQEELANEIGISKTSVANYELGTRKVPLSIMLKFADYFNVSLDDLVGNKKNTDKTNKHLNSNNYETLISILNTANVTDEELDKFIEYVNFIVSQRKK